MEQIRTCTYCLKSKPIEDFYKTGNSYFKMCCDCRALTTMYMTKYRKNHTPSEHLIEYKKKYMKEYRKNNRERANENNKRFHEEHKGYMTKYMQEYQRKQKEKKTLNEE